jgi:hypothetical protein
MSDLDVITFRCRLCWTEFDSPAELAQHEQQEDDGLRPFDEGAH